MELELCLKRPSSISVASSQAQAMDCWELCEVQCPAPSCLVLEFRPTFISSRVTQISTDPLTLSSQLAQVWLPHPCFICLTSFPRLTLRSVTSFWPTRLCRTNSATCSITLPFCPACLPVFHLPLSPSCFSSLWHRSPPMLRPELSPLLEAGCQGYKHREAESLNVIRWERWAERGKRGNSSLTIWSLGSWTTH